MLVEWCKKKLRGILLIVICLVVDKGRVQSLSEPLFIIGYHEKWND